MRFSATGTRANITGKFATPNSTAPSAAARGPSERRSPHASAASVAVPARADSTTVGSRPGPAGRYASHVSAFMSGKTQRSRL